MWCFDISMKKGLHGVEIRVNNRGNARKDYYLKEQQTLFFYSIIRKYSYRYTTQIRFS